MAVVKTELQPPPTRKGKPEDQLNDLYRWARTYHERINKILQDEMTSRGAVIALPPLDDIITDVPAALTQTISNPPTQAEVQAIQVKINQIIGAMANVALRNSIAKTNAILTATRTTE